jgi:hypothetical protein
LVFQSDFIVFEKVSPQSDIKNGQHLQIWEKHGGDNQKWDFKRDS